MKRDCSIRYSRSALKNQLRLIRKINDVELTLVSLERSLRRQQSARCESGTATAMTSDGAISGIDISQNFGEAAGADIEKISAGESKNSEQGQRNVLNMSDYLSRPVELYKAQLAANTDIAIRLDVWNDFLAIPSVRAKLRNYAYLRANLHVRISVSGMMFHRGRLLISYQPFDDHNQTLVNLLASNVLDGGFKPLLMNYLSQAPGSALINVNENKPVEIVCPYIATKPMFRLYNNATTAIAAGTDFSDVVNTGDLFIYSLNNIFSTEGTSTPVYIQVYAWMTEVELGTNTATQLAVTTESGGDERKTGPLESFATNAATISGLLRTAPVIGPLAQASSMIFSGLGKVASFFGWSKPILVKAPNYVKNNPYQNSALMIGYDTSERVVLDPLQELTVDPRVTGSTEDEMTIHHICSRKSYLTSFTWADDSAAMTVPLWVCRVTPNLVTSHTISTAVYNQPTSMAYAAAPFMYWRGTITFRIEIVCSSFHRGKIAVYYEPNIAQIGIINTQISMNKQFLKVVDIQETQCFDVCVNWAAPRAWLLVQPPQYGFLNYDYPESTTGGIGYVNGFIGILPFTDLQSPDSSDISVNVYVWSDDMQYNGYSQSNFPTARTIYTESGPATSNNCINSQEITCVDLNDSTATTATISQEHFGEQPISFRALLKRYITTSFAHSIGTQATTGTYKFEDVIYPPNNLEYGAAPATLIYDLFSYLRYAYLGIRGGMRIRCRPFMANGNLANSYWTRMGLNPPTATALTPAISFTAYNATAVTNIAQPNGDVLFSPITQAGVEAEFPFYSNNLFAVSFSSTYSVDTTDDVMCPLWYRNYHLIWDENTTTTSVVTKLVVDRAAAEDFCYLRYQGAPYYTSTYFLP